MRRLILFAAAALLTVGINGHAKAQATGLCRAKDEVISHLPGAVHWLKINGEEAEVFRAFANSHYDANGEKDGEGFTYILTWVDQADSDAVWFIFDEHNCLTAKGWLPKSDVGDWIGAES